MQEACEVYAITSKYYIKYINSITSMHRSVIMNIFVFILLLAPVSAHSNHRESISAVVGASLGSAVAVFLVLIILYLVYWDHAVEKKRIGGVRNLVSKTINDTAVLIK